MKPIKSYLIICFLAVILFLVIRLQGLPGQVPEVPFSAKVTIRDQTIIVEIAASVETQAKGLSGRQTLEENKGMLFVFEQTGQHSFWMKEMKFPLDIVWIKDGETCPPSTGAEGDCGRVVDMVTNAPVPEEDRILKYIPEKEANYVLEVNAGLVDRYGWQIGDEVVIEFDKQ